MAELELWTDGACSGNPGPGGWAALLIYGQSSMEIAGSEMETTNNRMVLTAVVQGLKRLKDGKTAAVHSDSSYVCNAINNGWLRSWKRNGWKTKAGDPVKNQEIWEALDQQIARLNVSFKKVKGHAEIAKNERCDQLAVQARLAAARGEVFVWKRRRDA